MSEFHESNENTEKMYHSVECACKHFVISSIFDHNQHYVDKLPIFANFSTFFCSVADCDVYLTEIAYNLVNNIF